MGFILIFGWIILSVLVANMGSSKSIGGLGAFFVSIFFSPLIGLLVVIASSNKEKVKKVNNNVAGLTANALKKYNIKEYHGAIMILEKALMIEPNEKLTHYNLSSMYSLIKHKEKSFFHLERAVELGFKNYSQISASKDFKWLKEQPEFEKFMQNGYKFNKMANTHNSFLDELKKLAELKEKGIITEVEFSELKGKILKSN